MKKALALVISVLMLVSVLALGASAEAGKLKDSVVEAAYGTPVIDGTIDDVWSKATPQKFDKYDFVTKAEVDFDAGQFRVLWDEKYIYILWEINDTTMCTAEQEWAKPGDWINRDGVGVAIGTEFEGVGVNKTKSSWHLIQAHGVEANYAADNLNVFVMEDLDAYAAAGNDQNKVTDASKKMFATKETSYGYLIEAKINPAASKNGIQSIKLEEGAVIAFDTWVDANEDPSAAPKRDHLYTWADRAASSSNNNSTKGTLKLLAKPAPETQAPETKAPETQAPETKAPETKAPETGKPGDAPATSDGVLAVMLVALVALTGTAVVIAKKSRD